MSETMRARRPLRTKVTLGVIGLLTIFGLIWTTLFVRQVNEDAAFALESEGYSSSVVVAHALRGPVATGDRRAADSLLASLAAVPNARWAILLRSEKLPDGNPTAPSHFAVWKRIDAVLSAPPDEPARQPRPGYSIAEDQGALYLFLPIVARDEMRGEVARGELVVALSVAGRELALRSNLTRAALVGLLLLLVGAALASAFGAVLVRPIDELTQVAARILATGDLRLEVDIKSDDEVGVLAASFRRLVDRQRSTLRALQDSAERLGHQGDEMARVGDTVSGSSADIGQAVSASNPALKDLRLSLEAVARHMEELMESAREGVTRGQQVTSANREVADAVGKMSTEVQRSAGDVETLASSFQEVARRIETVNGVLSRTLLAVQRIDAAIEEVEDNAQKTAQFTAGAAQRMERGKATLAAVLGDLEGIEHAVRAAGEVIGRLGDRLSAIGGVVDVINDIAEQTSLLSLNASIIAAKTADEGHGFGVVAQEIKALAQRTRSSTAEIAHVVRTLQTEARTADTAMSDGLHALESGVERGRQTLSSLNELLETSKQASERIQVIAGLTQRQARETRQVTEAVEEAAQAVRGIHHKTGEQVEQAQSIRRATAALTRLTEHVREAASQQKADSSTVLRTIEEVFTLVELVSVAQRQEAISSDEVQRSVDAIGSATSSQAGAVQALEAAIRELRAEADQLRGEARGLRV